MNEAIKTLEENLKNETVVIAVSGGPDSMTLLHLMNSLKEKLNLSLVCAHVNHKVRSESDEEAAMVEAYCKENDIIFKYMTIKYYNKKNFHQDAREKRYAFFEKCVKECQAKHLLTAHHGDDLMETILMRIVRGADFKSYAGFSEKIVKENYTILRPLIHYTKKEIEAYALENKIPFRIDKSNESDKYTRNRFRKYVVPSLKAEDEKVHEKFYKFSKLTLMYEEYISKAVMESFQAIYKRKKLNIEKFKKLDELIQIKIINEIIKINYPKDLDLITDKHRRLIFKIIMSDKPNQTVSLPNHKYAVKAYNDFYILKEKSKSAYKIELVDKTTLPNGKSIQIVSKATDNSNYTLKLNSQEVKMPLYIRSKLEGDKIEIKGLNGRKKVKDIFIDEKTPKEERDLWPILVDSDDNILWIAGLKKSKFDKQKDENYDIIVKYL